MPVAELPDFVKQAIAQYETEHKAKPQRVNLADGISAVVERPERSAAAPLADKVAIVTGAAGAIGAGICRELLAKGARVAASDLNRQSLDALVSKLNAGAPGRVIAVTMDVTDETSVTAGFDQIACVGEAST